LHWVVRPWLTRRQWASTWQRQFAGEQPGLARPYHLAFLVVFVPIAIWALTLFDCSAPLNRSAVERQTIGSDGGAVSRGKSLRVALERTLRLDAPWPAGCYIRAFRLGMGHAMSGHLAYLNGERSQYGWRRYFAVVASYKVPIGIAIVLLLSLATFWRTPPRWAEWGLIVPMLAWTLFMLNSRVNLGFRHFLPPYAFMLMLASRCVMGSGRVWWVLAWAGVAATGLHALSYHPDYFCYMNAPWNKPYLAITDCNVDWGQSLKQVRAWLDAQPRGAKRVSLFYFGHDEGSVKYYLNERVVSLDENSPRPTSGLLLISPVRLAGVYEESDPYAALRCHEPDAVIGNSILVFDLDRLGRGSAFRWPRAQGWPVHVANLR
jgi:hypothetical protein